MIVTPEMLEAFQVGFSNQLHVRHRARYKQHNECTQQELMSAEQAGLLAMLKKRDEVIGASEYVLVTTGDDGLSKLTFCTGRIQLFDTVRAHVYTKPEECSQEDLEELSATVDDLIENGFVDFEGDPGLILHKLRPT